MRYIPTLALGMMLLCSMVTGLAQSSTTLPSATALNDEDSLNFEDSVIYMLNKVRMYPQKSAEEYASSWFYDASDTFDTGLYKELTQMSAIKKSLIADSSLRSMAECHALSSGHNSHVGHKRLSNCPEDFDAECIQYGLQSAAAVVWELLEDNGVQDLGHRKILLSPEYVHIGVAQAFHRSYRYISVLDLSEDR